MAQYDPWTSQEKQGKLTKKSLEWLRTLNPLWNLTNWCPMSSSTSLSAFIIIEYNRFCYCQDENILWDDDQALPSLESACTSFPMIKRPLVSSNQPLSYEPHSF